MTDKKQFLWSDIFNSEIVEKWKNGGLFFAIAKVDLGVIGPRSRGYHYCGYVRLPKRVLREEGCDGIVAYVPVHGGITYSHEDSQGGMIYGFDCAHCNDHDDPRMIDLKWLHDECERMAIALAIAEKYEADYLLARDSNQKAAIIDNYHKELAKLKIEFNLSDNILAMLHVMSGDL